VQGMSPRVGVQGASTSGDGAQGFSTSGVGVRGSSISSVAVQGVSTSGDGMQGFSTSGVGVRGSSISSVGASGVSTNSVGASGVSTNSFGVIGDSTSSVGVLGVSRGSGAGVRGVSTIGIGVSGSSGSAAGVSGSSGSAAGVSGRSTSFAGVFGFGRIPGAAGLFDGTLVVVNGFKLFKIDHPLDPENRYLSHACVESSELKNLYDGVAQLDRDGAAWIELPEWFEALNGDLRYQLTAVGAPAPGLHVAEEVSGNRFKMAGGEAGMKVCWQVTGTRKDRWAAANPFEVEQEKREEERGRYLEPSLYDAPEEQRVTAGPPAAEALAEEQRPPQPSDIDLARLEEERLRLDEWMRLAEEQPPEMAPSSLDFARLREAHRRQIDESRRLMEEQRRKVEELRRRVAPQEEAPPETV
jgi:hypothetical protein